MFAKEIPPREQDDIMPEWVVELTAQLFIDIARWMRENGYIEGPDGKLHLPADQPEADQARPKTKRRRRPPPHAA